jgi:hypothetical protein
VVIAAATVVVIVLKAAAVPVDIVAAIVAVIRVAGAIMTIAEVTTTIAISRRFVLSFINLESEGPFFWALTRRF